nr:2320_t:CDS:2 [Entrophospora candida]
MPKAINILSTLVYFAHLDHMIKTAFLTASSTTYRATSPNSLRHSATTPTNSATIYTTTIITIIYNVNLKKEAIKYQSATSFQLGIQDSNSLVLPIGKFLNIKTSINTIMMNASWDEHDLEDLYVDICAFPIIGFNLCEADKVDKNLKVIFPDKNQVVICYVV